MKVELKEEVSTDHPERVVCAAARGDYREDSLVGLDVSDDEDYYEIMEPVDGDTIEEKTRNLIRRLLRRGHFGVTEHPQAYFAVEGVSRVTMAQITRHRHLSFDVQSMRYVDFEEAAPTVPPSFEDNDTGYFHIDNADKGLEEHFATSVKMYKQFVEHGIPKEDARFVLPLGTQVNMTFSGNVRTLLHVLDLRHSGKAQWEVRELAEKIIEEMEEWCPIIVEEWRDNVKNASLQSP